MKNKFLNVLLITIISLVILCGCGKFELPSGELTSDSSYLTVGKFKEQIVDISAISNPNCLDCSFTDSAYSFLLLSKKEFSSEKTYYLVSFSEGGKNSSIKELYLPASYDGMTLMISDMFFDSSSTDVNSITPDDCSVYYSGFNFDDNGSLSADCEIYATYYDFETGKSDYINSVFHILWNNAGECTGISLSEGESVSSSSSSILVNKTGDHYSYSESGIIQTDSDGRYIGKYFDYVNSDVRTSGFDAVVIKDSSSFAGLYHTSDGVPVLACFTSDSSLGLTAPNTIVLATNAVDENLLSLVYDYNSFDLGARIAVVDYLDMSLSSDPEEAWALLKDDLNAGFEPDIILQNRIYDPKYISSLSSGERILDVSDAFKNDPDVKDIVFSDKASSEFYNTSSVYSIVPAFSYRTVIGPADKFTDLAGWGVNDFKNFSDPLISRKVLFYRDTKETFLNRILDFNGSDYVDPYTGQASFDSDSFKILMNYAASLPEDIDGAMEFMYSDTNLAESLLKDVTCNVLADVFMDGTAFSKGSYSIVGFPSGDNGGSGVLVPTYSFMINAKCKFTNECWSFIKLFLTDEYQSAMYYSIPVTEAGYTAWLQYKDVMSNGGFLEIYKVDNVDHYIGFPTPVQIQDISNSISECHRYEFTDYNVKQIVIKYANAYFEGELSLDDAAKQIDTEVESYLAG